MDRTATITNPIGANTLTKRSRVEAATSAGAARPGVRARGAASTVVRFLAALTAAATGVIYLLIALGVLDVGAATEAAKAAPTFIPAAAAGAFFLGAILLLAFNKRIVHILGGLLQVITIVGYFAVASGRNPPYELWGIVLKIFQVITLVALVYLALHPARRGAGINAARARA
jgi:hypothetical protein